MTNQKVYKAYAKINIGLDVVRKREDGYHEVRMIMQTVDLFDRVGLKIQDGGDIKVRTNLYYLPSNKDNLVYKAARLILDTAGRKEGVDIDLQKHIPVAAGMAGGSSDAAAVLYGLNEMLKLQMDMDKLMELGVKLGADVPYCLIGGTKLSEGIGEKLSDVKAMPPCKIVVVKPTVNVSTKHVYENLHVADIPADKHPDMDKVLKAFDDGDISGIATSMSNILETVTEKEYPVIADIKSAMMEAGALGSIMSGSGPTVFGIFNDDHKAAAAYELFRDGALKSIAKRAYMTKAVNDIHK